MFKVTVGNWYLKSISFKGEYEHKPFSTSKETIRHLLNASIWVRKFKQNLTWLEIINCNSLWANFSELCYVQYIVISLFYLLWLWNDTDKPTWHGQLQNQSTWILWTNFHPWTWESNNEILTLEYHKMNSSLIGIWTTQWSRNQTM